mgnify:CR=1 FL=1
MRKLFALLALVLGVVSCQNDPEGFGANVGGEQVTNVTVALPELTRASSTAGAITNVDLTGDYTIRYIFQVYNSDFTESKAQQVKYSDDASVSFPVRLVPGRDYNFVVWADIVENANPVDGVKCADLHYNTADLKAISLNNTWEAMDETRDAYTVSQLIKDFKGTEGYTLTLKRPFAKLRVITTDMAELLGLELENATVTYSTPHYNAFNALDSEVVGDSKNRNIEHKDYTIKAYAEDSETNKVLFTDYFFAKDDVVKFNMSVAMSDGKSVDRSFTTDIPVKRNYLTTLIGDILTEGNNITVEVEEGFDNNVTDKPWYVEYFSGVKNETIVLDETGIYIFNNLTINADPAVLVKAPAEAVIDLQGTVSFKGKQGIVVQDGAKLTINGVAETRAAERAGKLIVEATEGSAIGGNSITINNLAGLTAKAGNVEGAFGIGAIDAEVVINNTKIDYVSGAFVQPLCINDPKYGKSEPEGGAAIGGKKVTIDGVELVKAEGGSKSAAIGNRYWQNTEVIIKNSTLGDVFGGNASAAIGGSRYAGDAKHNVKILIENSTITNAVGGQFGAGIGSGYDTHCNQQNFTATNDIVIKNSTITAKGGKYAPGIGTGFHSAYLTGSITESTIVSVAGDEVWYKGEYTTAQNLGYGIVDPAREFQGENANVTFTVDGVVIPSPVVNASYVTVYSAEELQAALDGAKDGDNLIRFGANIAGNATIKQADKKNILLDGCGYEFDGTLYIHGSSRYTGAETLNIANVNFKSDVAKWFIDSNSTAQAERYAHNVTIKNCTFTSEAADNSVAVCGARFRQAYTVTFKDCKATNTFYMAWFTGCSNLTVEDCEVINNEEGITFGPCNKSVIKNSKIEADLYGVRYEATTSYEHNITIDGCELKSFIPVSVRYIKAGTNKPINVAFSGTNTLTKGGLYDVAFCANEYKSGVAPEIATGEWTISGDENYTVFPKQWIVTNEAELQAAITNATAEFSTISFGADITGNAYIAQREGIDLVIDGCDKKFDGGFIVDGKNRSTGTDKVLFQNINFYTETTGALTFISCPGTYNGEKERYSHYVTIDNCTFSAKELSENVGAINAQKTYHLKVTNCEASNLHSLLQVQSCDNDVTIENVKAINCKNGISVGNTAFPTIRGAEIKVKGYGVRGDADASRGALKLTDMNIEAAFPIAIRKVNTNGYSVALDGTNTLTTSNTYQIVFTSNSDEAVLEDPTGTYTLTGAEGMKVFPVRPAAKVGSTEYLTIDEAIAAWTNNTTLTLLDNVTLSDVVTIKSTEHHILDLGTYTLTAAEGKNAFEITACGTGAAERYAITINADATNPGSINAGSKAIVYYDYSKGTAAGADDRPIIKINGGVFNASTASWGTAGIYFKGGSKARQAATLNISGGEFYCSINGQSKSKMIISGGLFHYSVGSQGDSTANRLISGGTFKTLGFMTADSNNTKFWFGTSMANSNVGLYINDDDYLVVGGAPITDFGDKFAAKATNPTKWSSYLQYSSAATNGLYYTNAEMAIKKHGEANVVLK